MTASPPPAPTRRKASGRASVILARLVCFVLVAAVAGACSAPSPSRPGASTRPPTPHPAVSGDPTTRTVEPATRLAMLAGNPRDARLVVLGPANCATTVDLPAVATAWISADRTGRLLATTADGRLFLAGPPSAGGIECGRGIGDPGWREVVPAHAGARPAAPLSFGMLAPDGRTIAVLAADFELGTAFDLVLVDVESGTATSLRIPAWPDGAAPAWLPDGGLVVVAREPGRDLAGLFLVHPAGPGPVVHVEGEAYGIAVSADGRVAAVERADGRLAVGPAGLFLGADPPAGPGTDAPASTGRPVRLVAGPPGTAAGPFTLDASGTRLAVSWLDDAGGPAAMVRYRVGRDGSIVETGVPAPAGASTAVVAWLP